jgi:hypothetical protein
MNADIKQAMNKELATWRSKLDELKTKTGHARVEARAKRDKVLKSFDEAYQQATDKLSQARDKAGSETAAVTGSLQAGWNELRKTYQQLRTEKSGTHA